MDHVQRCDMQFPQVNGVFCSQKAATPWAQAMGLECSARGPSLDVLTKQLGVKDFRAQVDGRHGAMIDSQQTALVVEALRRIGSCRSSAR